MVHKKSMKRPEATKKRNCIHFEKVSVKVQPLTLNLESWIVRKILEMIGRVATSNSPVYDAMQVFKSHKSPS